jgi:branched-chain amino acid transport system permease protein
MPDARPPRWSRVAVGLLVLAAVVYPIPLQAGGYTYFQTVGFLVFIYAMLGIGWNVIGGLAGQFDFGPSVFFAVGAYVAALLAIHWELNAWLGLLAGVIVAALACALLTYPITKLRGHYFAIATVAIWMIAQPIGATWEFINGSRGLFIPLSPGTTPLAGALTLQFPGRSKGLGFYYAALALCGLTLLAGWLVERSKLGFYFRAIRDDQEGAEGIGVNSRLYKVLARSVMAGIFAAGGVLYSFWALAVFPDQVLDVNWNVLPIMAAVVGGIGHLWGPVLGSVILIPISQLMTATLGAGPLAGRGIDLIIYGAVIMFIAGWRPNGLLSLPWATWAAAILGRPEAESPRPGR